MFLEDGWQFLRVEKCKDSILFSEFGGYGRSISPRIRALANEVLSKAQACKGIGK